MLGTCHPLALRQLEEERGGEEGISLALTTDLSFSGDGQEATGKVIFGTWTHISNQHSVRVESCGLVLV